ncbi:MAG: hypothetical protein MJZ12_01305 [Prevotella sp.]|nr:hypothetical protein [Prevotella sp.]
MATGDNNQVKSKRDSFMERMKGKYPDRAFADDEEIFGQISDDYDGYDKELMGYKEREKAFSDMFTSDPRSAAFLMQWKNGGDPSVELIRQYGKDGIEAAINDPEKLEEIAAADKEYVERVAKEKEYEALYQKNIHESLGLLRRLSEEKGISDDKIDDAWELLKKIVHDGVIGIFTEETVDLALKALSHDEDVNNAGHEGEVRGKNAKINETLRKKEQGDGLAPLNSKIVSGGEKKRNMNIFDFAEAAK